MGKTYKKNSRFRPKVRGRVFVKDYQPWKNKKKPIEDGKPPVPFEDIPPETLES